MTQSVCQSLLPLLYKLFGRLILESWSWIKVRILTFVDLSQSSDILILACSLCHYWCPFKWYLHRFFLSRAQSRRLVAIHKFPASVTQISIGRLPIRIFSRWLLFVVVGTFHHFLGHNKLIVHIKWWPCSFRVQVSRDIIGAWTLPHLWLGLSFWSV